MRVAYAGTPEFAAAALAAILRAGYTVPLVLTQPDRPAGRGLAMQPSPVKKLALQHGLPVHQPASLKTLEARQPLMDAQADVLVVAAYGLILPQAALDVPRLGCLNIHASLLPRWRGAAPIQRALQAGDDETGVTIMQMDAGLDTGPMLIMEGLAISGDDNAQTLHDKLAALGAQLIVKALDKLARGELQATRQPEAGVTYAAKIDKREAELHWHKSAVELERTLRAFNPYPGALGHLNGTAIKLWAGRVGRAVDARGEPGTVLDVSAAGITVACGDGALRLTELQKPGGKRLPAADFLRGFPIAPGARFARVQD